MHSDKPIVVSLGDMLSLSCIVATAVSESMNESGIKMSNGNSCAQVEDNDSEQCVYVCMHVHIQTCVCRCVCLCVCV